MDYGLCNNGKTFQDEALKPVNPPITINRTVTFHLHRIKIFPTSSAATFNISNLSENKGLVQRLGADVVEFYQIWREPNLVCVFGGSDHPARTRRGVFGREEGRPRGSAGHPASGPHLEPEAAAR